MTLCLEGRCSIQLSYGQFFETCGRGEGIRTPDILLPKQARYRTALRPAMNESEYYAKNRSKTQTILAIVFYGFIFAILVL